MITISLCMIVKNEEAVLGRVLEQMRGIADEIIVVDTGSADRTREIFLHNPTRAPSQKKSRPFSRDFRLSFNHFQHLFA